MSREKIRYYLAVWPFLTRYFARRAADNYAHGYVCGGHDERVNWRDGIERLNFPFDGKAEHTGRLTEECPKPLACRADHYGHGYVFGGEGGKDITIVDRLMLSNGGDARWAGVIDVRHWDGYAVSSSEAAYVGAGSAALVGDLSTVHRGNFPFGGWMVECGSTEEIQRSTAEADDQAGYIFGGQLPYALSRSIHVYEFPKGHAFVVAGLMHQKRVDHGSCSSTAEAYVVGGHRVRSIERFRFKYKAQSDHVTEIVGSTLEEPCPENVCGCASREHGYICGGRSGRYCTGPSAAVTRLNFPFDSGSLTLVGELTQERIDAAAL